MAKIDDMIFNGIKVILSGTPAGIAKSGPKLQNLIKKTMKEKKITGKPKGKSPSMVLGSASKAGMQSKQGQRIRRPRTPGLTPGFPGKPPRKPLQNFLRPGKKPKGKKA
jgi:hypothetical protein